MKKLKEENWGRSVEMSKEETPRHTLWVKPLIQVCGNSIFINDKCVYKNGHYCDIEGNRYAE